MAYKTILVFFPSEERTDSLITVTVAMAQRHQAHVIGLYVVPAPRVMPAVGMHIPPEVIDNQRIYFRKEAERIKERFDRVFKTEGLANEWRTVVAHDPVTSRVVSEHARMCDLVISGQPDFGADSADLQNLPADVLMECGRPILMVPRAGKFEGVGDCIFVAWNGTRESARAVFDALPLLTAASKVRVHWVDPETDDTHLSSSVPGAEVATSLARHGVKAEAGHSVSDGISVGDEILSRLADQGCDLLVMGGYGHSRFTEMVFGGVTRHILRHMTVPVLMSH